MKTLFPLVSAALCWSLLSGCAQQPPVPDPEIPPPTEARTESAAESYEATSEARRERPVRAFTSETLYSLLAAELASSRELYDVALSNYYQQALVTRDPQVAARATLYARFLDADNLALETAELWLDISPDDPEAQLNAALLMMQGGRLNEAFELSRRLHAQGEYPLFQNIAANAANLPNDRHEALRARFSDLLEQYPEDVQLLIGTGLMYHQQNQPAAALALAERALKLERSNSAAAILRASALHQLGRLEEAISGLETLLRRNPNDFRVRLQYARLLTELDLALAQEQFETLLGQSPMDPDLLLSLGLIALEQGDRDTAANSFETLLDLDEHLSPAHYYLAGMAEHDEDLESALMHYLQVEPGNDFYSATVRILEILIDQGDLVSAEQHMQRVHQRFPEQGEALYFMHAQALTRAGEHSAAKAVLDQGLEHFPTSTELLYSRGMVHFELDNIEASERDLRELLSYQPDSAHGLNALGYILTDRTERHDEAYTLISQALALKPDDGAILDSMGWVYYRLGDHERALHYLERAWAVYPDHEVAAHLGELLWVTGERERARAVWREGLDLKPESPVILETIERLQADD
ncbi:tetratricopeptide repeat protein [Marinimicrobium alkaliphilum]|uniref:tetratricopeptide repeat protein n=1 Tax=Marinimicrobium alkaliphilum TaxID=2202654 RepID=UPI000DB90C09|nr:tetratricopeptide repeat protein [Marinimicrobium alkaliphilum]